MRTGERPLICTGCGRENDPGRKFCSDCGEQLVQLCANCGTSNLPTDRFCGECGEQLASTVRRAPTAGPRAPEDRGGETSQERRMVSVLFADLTGFTPYAEERDPEEVRGLLTRYFDTATDIIERFGGTVEKFIGDAVMGVWGATTAREDDAERAVRTALELVEAVAKLGADEGLTDLALRVGVHTGEAAVTAAGERQGSVVGDMVNTASRLQSSAPPGGVLVGESTYRMSEGAIAFTPAGERTLKGKSEPVPAWRALHVLGMRGGDRRGGGLEPPFVGRNEELRLLKDQLHATGREGRSRLVSITGIGGVGKSRLVWEFLKYVDGLIEDVYWHEGRSPSYGEGVAFWALAEMVRQRARIAETDDPQTTRERLSASLAEHVPDGEERAWLEPRLAGLLGLREMPSGERGELFSAFRRFFERISERGTTVLVFEDLQWADAGLLDFVEELPEWSRDRPILIITLSRPELLDRRPSWGTVRRSFMSLHLGPLTPDDMRELIAGMVPGIPNEAVDVIANRAAGVPLYAVEFVRMLLLDERLQADDDGRHRLVGDLSDLSVPETLHAVIGARLDHLDAEDRALLQDAAVLGQTFTLETIASLTTGDPDTLSGRLSGLVRKELITIDVDPRSPERGQYGFVQGIIREVAYGRVSRADRRERHVQVADHFEAIGDVEMSAIVVDHYLKALDAVPDGPGQEELRQRALGALRRAADRAAGLHAHEQVLTYCEHALDILRGSGDEPAWWERAAGAAHALLRSDVAERYAQRLIDHHEAAGDERRALRARILLARMLVESHLADRALDLLGPQVEALGDIEGDPDAVEAVALVARTQLLLGQMEAAATSAEHALTAAERLDLLPVIADGLITRGTALGDLGRPREGAALLRAALELAREEALLLVELRASGNISYLLWAEDPETTREILSEAFEQARRLGERGWMAFLAGNLLESSWLRGDWESSLDIIEAFEELDLPDIERALFTAWRAAVVAMRGDAEGAEALLRSVAAVAETETDPQERRFWHMIRGSVALMVGEPDRAFAHAETVIGFDTFGHPDAYRVGTHAAMITRSRERLTMVAEGLAALPRQVRLVRGLRRIVEAALAVLDGDEDRATAELEAFRRAWGEAFPLERGLLLAGFGTLAMGRHPAAEAAVRDGRDILEGLGATAYLEHYVPQPH